MKTEIDGFVDTRNPTGEDMNAHQCKAAKCLNRTDEIIAKLREAVPVIVSEKGNGEYLIAQGHDVILINTMKLSEGSEQVLERLVQEAKAIRRKVSQK